MLAKLAAKNQLTLPKRALEALGSQAAPAYFEVEVKDWRIVLTPAGVGSGEAVRRKLADLGLTEADIADAVAIRRGCVICLIRLRNCRPHAATIATLSSFNWQSPAEPSCWLVATRI